MGDVCAGQCCFVFEAKDATSGGLANENKRITTAKLKAGRVNLQLQLHLIDTLAGDVY